MLAMSPPFTLFGGEVLYAIECEKWTIILIKMLFKTFIILSTDCVYQFEILIIVCQNQ
jgi:hypothetical protein